VSWKRRIARLGGVFRGRERERDLRQEIRLHLEMEEQEYRESGVSPEEAHYAALRRFGNVALAQERSGEMWSWRSLETLRQDIRYELRQIRRSPAFALVVALTLALGIGANSAIFSVVNAVVLRPLPYLEPDRLVVAGLVDEHDPSALAPYGAADYLAAHDRERSFASFAAIAEGENVFTYTGSAEPLKVRGTPATAEFFSVLGVSPALGRAFAPGEDAPGRAHEVVLSHAFWEQRFGADPQTIGHAITLDGDRYTIVGVMPADFHFGPHDNDDLWPLLQIAPRNVRYPFWLLPIGRLKPGVSEAQARADLSAVARDLKRQFPDSSASAASIDPLKTQIVGDVRTALLMLLGAVGLVLLIATVNVANLQVAGITARERELSIRAALGAGRGRIARQVLTESLLLAALGGVLGLLLAYWGVRVLIALAPAGLPRLKEIAVDGRVLAFTAAVSLLSGLLSGLAPVMHGFGRRLDESLRGGAQNLSEQRRRRLRQALVVMEVSLSLVLLIGSGLLLRSFERLAGTSPGFNPQPLLSTLISLPEGRYKDAHQIVPFYEQLLDRVQTLPGVAAAGITMSLPPDLLNMRNPFSVPGQTDAPGTSRPLAVETSVSSGYFHTLGIPLLRGRFFEDSDRTRKDEILIINDTMARRYYPGQDPVGQQIKTGDSNPDSPWETIVGVVADVKYAGLDGPPEPTLYVPYFEDYWPIFSREMFLVVRAGGDPRSVAPGLRAAIRDMDRDLPVADLQTMNELLSDSVAQPRFRTLLLGVFAGLALLLAAVGIFGVMAYVVSRRTQEIGVRMALGASRSGVLGMVLNEGLRVVLIGVAIGVGEALALSRLIKSLLFGVEAADPATFIAVPLVMIVVALAACYVPARRATKVDPIIALRYE
jgi:predicted permease